MLLSSDIYGLVHGWELSLMLNTIFNQIKKSIRKNTPLPPNINSTSNIHQPLYPIMLHLVLFRAPHAWNASQDRQINQTCSAKF